MIENMKNKYIYSTPVVFKIGASPFLGAFLKMKEGGANYQLAIGER